MTHRSDPGRFPVYNGEVIDLGPRLEARARPYSALARELIAKGHDTAAVSKWLGSLVGEGPRPGEVPNGVASPATTPGVKVGEGLGVVSASRQLAPTASEWTELERNGAVVSPPYDPWTLVCTYEESEALPPCVEAMAVNLTGFGYELQPLYPLKDPETGQPIDPPPGAEDERRALELFLAAATTNPAQPIEAQLELVDRDVEITGNGYLEVLRDGEGLPAAFDHVRAYSLRLGRLSPPLLVDTVVRDPTSGDLVTVPRWRRFRSYVQLVGGRAVWFKEFGDPRAINSQTGEYLPAGQSWGLDRQGNDLNGTELVHFLIYCPYSPYGVPRWVGAAPSVRAGRHAAELVVAWFEDAPIGAKLAMVAGGAFKSDSYKKAIEKINAMTRGRENAFSLVVLEAESDAASGGDPFADTRDMPPRLALEDLAWPLPTELYHGDDSLIETANRRVRRMFRLSPLYTGDSDDFSHAAVRGARANGEEQVFAPIRLARWERWFNAAVLPARGARWWWWALKTPKLGDDSEAMGVLGELLANGGGSVNAAGELWNSLTGQEQPRSPDAWADKPWPLVQLMLQAGLDPNLEVGAAVAQLKADEERKAAEAAAQLEQLNASKGGTPAARSQAAKMVEQLAGAIELRRDLVAKFYELEAVEVDPDWYA